MFYVDKPPLNEELLVHFGVRGMKWGQRTKSSGSSGKKTDGKMSTGKKIGIGAAVVGGAAIAAIILSKRGRTPAVQIGKVNLRPTTMDKLREAQKMKIDNFNKMKPSFGKTQYFDSAKGTWSAPTSSALVRQSTAPRIPGESVYAGRLRRSGLKTSNVDMGSIADVRRAWADPNHVWDL